MDTLTRRTFLIRSGVAGGAAVVAGSAAITWSQLVRHAGTAGPGGDPILVVVTLYGGNDGLNTLIPYADPAYHSARPDLAYDPSQVLHLDGALGLNPAMTGLAKLWQAKQLAIVRGVGYPNPDFSHFRSMDIWQTASPAEPASTGWLGRWLDATGDDPVRAVNLGSVLPPLAVGARCTAAALPIGAYQPLSPSSAKTVTTLATTAPGDTPAESMVCAGYHAERVVAATFSPVLDPASQAGSADDQPVQAGSAGGQNDLKAQLDVVARCVRAGVPTKAYAVSLGGFDTHADEKGTQQTQLGVLDSALSGFLSEMAADPRGRSVIALVYSEFGRRVTANGSQGTDHGTAGPVFVAGVPVRGGFYGDEPSLTDLDAGDLKATTDFRSVYAELVDKVLHGDPEQVLGWQQQLGFLS